jgi:hypothetical protein
MWTTHYSNRRCNEIEKIKEHKMHLERLVTVKTMLDIKEPKKPGFLVFKAKKEKMEQEKKMKINFENRVLLTKIIDIEKKPSPYNPVILLPARCPAYDKTTYQIKKKKYDLDKNNLVNLFLT